MCEREKERESVVLSQSKLKHKEGFQPSVNSIEIPVCCCDDIIWKNLPPK